jgi:hypothetical protein
MDSNDLVDLGLAKTCSHFQVVQEPSGETYKTYCPRPVLEFGGFCSRHDEAHELVKQANLERKKTVLVEKQRLEEEILPKATQRILDILNNEEAKDADVIKIWQTTMDRIGLAAVQGLVVEGEIKVEAPLDILRRMLTAPVPEVEEIHDAEIVAEIEEGPTPPA